MSWHTDTSTSSTSSYSYISFGSPVRRVSEEKKPKRRYKKEVAEEEPSPMPTDQILFDPKELVL